LGEKGVRVCPGEGDKGWDAGCKGIVKKASLRSNAVKNRVVAGIVERRI
jgi:hypothetical protein